MASSPRARAGIRRGDRSAPRPRSARGTSGRSARWTDYKRKGRLDRLEAHAALGAEHEPVLGQVGRRDQRDDAEDRGSTGEDERACARAGRCGGEPFFARGFFVLVGQRHGASSLLVIRQTTSKSTGLANARLLAGLDYDFWVGKLNVPSGLTGLAAPAPNDPPVGENTPPHGFHGEQM